jgi:hypothetical protein
MVGLHVTMVIVQMWCRVIRWKFTEVSEENTTSIFRIKKETTDLAKFTSQKTAIIFMCY